MIYFLKNLFKQLQENNTESIKGFGWGDFHKFWSNGCNYPFLNVFSAQKAINGSWITLSLVISVMDVVRDDDTNLDEVENKTLAIIRDIYNLMKVNLTQQGIKVEDVANIDFFNTRGGDAVAGHTMHVNIRIFNGSDLCATLLNNFEIC